MRTTKASLAALVLSAMVAVASVGHAQAGLVLTGHAPRVGRRSLAAGFTPTPLSVPVQAGGSVTVDGLGLGPGCRGMVDRQPDYVVTWSGRTAQLRFFARSASDVTLLVQDPAGRFRCNDDMTPGTNVQPMVDVFAAPAGEYAVWVGNKTAGSVAATLFVTEDRALRP